ncbi:TniQ family protein [Variovorax ureilyticus]|uniref:TniQ family protein n=1 Tax=Variovorax ureilyticus TaxID=1836198 RepID=A0ABU8VLT6_9BURK
MMPISIPLPSDRQLVLRLAYVRGETLPSFIDRLANLYGVTLPQMLVRLGISSGCLDPLTGYGVVLAEDALRRFSFVTGLPDAQVADLLFSRYAGSVLKDFREPSPSLGAALSRHACSEWGYFKGSHLCPICLRESRGIWLSHWKLPWSFACVRHGILLLHRCPICQGRPRHGQTTGLCPISLDCVPEPILCNNARFPQTKGKARASRICACSFIELEAPKASPSTLAAQCFIDRILQNGVSPEPAPTTREFFDEMRATCALLLFTLEVEDFGHLEAPVDEAVAAHIQQRKEILERRQALPAHCRPRLPTYINGAPTDSFLMAAVVPKALEIVKARTSELVAEEIRAAADRLAAHKRRWIVANYFPLPDRVRVQIEDRLYLWTDFNHMIAARSAKAGQPGALRYEAKHIPQLFPEQEFARFRCFFDGVPEERARLFCSMVAVKLLGLPWSRVIHALDLPSSTRYLASDITVRLRRNGMYPEFALELCMWATSLSRSPDRIDYKARREALCRARDFSPARWRTLCQQAGVSRGRPHGRSRYAAAWMWADATSGDWRQSPASKATRGCLRRRSKYKAMVERIMPAMEAVLRAEGKRRIEEYARARGESLA